MYSPRKIEIIKTTVVALLGNQAAYVKVGPTIYDQILMARKQLHSSMSLTFSQEWLRIESKVSCLWALFFIPRNKPYFTQVKPTHL